MKKVVLIIIIVIVALGAGVGAGIFITNAKNKTVIADMQKKMQQSEAASQEKIRNNGVIISQLMNELQQTKGELEKLKPTAPPAPATAPTTTASVTAPAGNATTAAAPADNSIPTDAKQYTIKSGDSLWSIAKSQLGNGNRVNDILKLNPKLTAKSNLVVGSKLILPAK
jgi:nucleoid-associated protein YgaU